MATPNNPMDSKVASPEKHRGRTITPPTIVRRPCKEHSFLTDVADVRVMEQGLLQLLDDFHSGKLQAFGGTDMFDKMNEIREKQEQLAHLHFELDLQQDMRRLASEEVRARNFENLNKMIGKLHDLSSSIVNKSKETKDMKTNQENNQSDSIVGSEDDTSGKKQEECIIDSVKGILQNNGYAALNTLHAE